MSASTPLPTTSRPPLPPARRPKPPSTPCPLPDTPSTRRPGRKPSPSSTVASPPRRLPATRSLNAVATYSSSSQRRGTASTTRRCPSRSPSRRWHSPVGLDDPERLGAAALLVRAWAHGCPSSRSRRTPPGPPWTSPASIDRTLGDDAPSWRARLLAIRPQLGRVRTGSPPSGKRSPWPGRPATPTPSGWLCRSSAAG